MITQAIKIRRMCRADVERIIELERASYGNHHWSEASFYNELSNELAHYFCACSPGGELLGYSGCWQILEEAHITNLAISPSHRRKHIGEALLVNIINNCRENGVKYITLEVRISNTAAIKLYEKYGFKSLGTRKGYYQDNNEDALIMWTENIFYDKFKNKFNKNIAQLSEKIDYGKK